MQQNNISNTRSLWRFIVGLIVGSLLFILSNTIFNMNIVILISGILLASDIAHLKSPRENAIMGALIGSFYGLYLLLFQYEKTFQESVNVLENIWLVPIIILIAGVFHGIVGFISGKILKNYRESNGFLF